MIKKIKSIANLAVFKNFEWDRTVIDGNGAIKEFKHINIIYGRNYSGKTTLSRIIRALETGSISDKYEKPSFRIEFSDGTEATQVDLRSHQRTIRVFNEDFVKENLKFIINSDETIEPFAILGDKNNEIEKEIEALQIELGSNEQGKETGLYAKRSQLRDEYRSAKSDLTSAESNLDSQLSTKAIDRHVGIKYHFARFGDQNYTKAKLEKEIKQVLETNNTPATDTEKKNLEKLVSETPKAKVTKLPAPSLNFDNFSKRARNLITKQVGVSNKIEALVQNAILNRWVSEGRALHANKFSNCQFCGSSISQNRWAELEKHFDEESEKLESGIITLIEIIDKESESVKASFNINKSTLYSQFHGEFDAMETRFDDTSKKYIQELSKLRHQLEARRENIIKALPFQEGIDYSSELETVFSEYEALRSKSNGFTSSLYDEQAKAKTSLRLSEIVEFLTTIKYTDQVAKIAELRGKSEEVAEKGKEVTQEIEIKQKAMEDKKRQLNDEEKGALKVNQYLTDYFGHNFLSLVAISEQPQEDSTKKVRFEVIRDGKKAYHLSEGECSLLAFCYFLAKLDDVHTANAKPIIWIDDPISSLDGNHIFFIYSLIATQIVKSNDFEQLFVSTHNLDFLKYLKRLKGKFPNHNDRMQQYDREHFVVNRIDKVSALELMPKYLKEYVTEFNYLFHQIYKCANINVIDDSNYTTFYNFGNNARKFLEIYLYYRYPDFSEDEEKLKLFFGEGGIPSILIDRINNEYSHLSGVFERGATPIEVPEMKKVAQNIIDNLKKDSDQYESLLRSVGEA